VTEGGVVAQFVRRDHGHKHDQVFQPLMRAKTADQRSELGVVPWKDFPDLRLLRRAPRQPLPRVHEDGFTRASPNVEIRRRVARVIETAFAESFRERGEFGVVAQICFAIACKDFIEHTQMLCDRFGHFHIRRSGENDFAPGAFLFAQPGEKFLSIREGCGMHVDVCGEFLFEEGTSAQQPDRRDGGAERSLTQQAHERFPHHVAADERPIQVHSERDQGWSGRVGSDRHFHRARLVEATRRLQSRGKRSIGALTTLCKV